MTEGIEQHTQEAGSIFHPAAHFPSIGPETIFHIGSFPIANSTLMLLLTLLVVSVVSFFLNKTKSEIPGKLQNIFEMLYESIEDLLVQLTGDKVRAKALVGTLGALVVFIGLSNFMGHIPILSSITYDGAPLFRSATADFNTTFALAFGSVLIVQIIGFRERGIHYLGHFFKFKEVYRGFKQGIGPGLMSLVEFFVGLLEFIGEFIRIISLSVRLFGNMFAGEVVMAIALGAFAFVLPAVWLGFEFLVVVVQALVFMSLVTVYYTMVLKDDTGGH